MSLWNGAIVIVTGAASGIGRAISEALIVRGAEVWLADIDASSAEQAERALGRRAHAVELDVRRADAFQELVDRVGEEHGRIDFLFNNAGIGVGGEAHELRAEHWDRVIDVNVRGVTNGVAAAYPVMVRQRRGHIVNTASVAGLAPVPLLTPYAMSKHAVVGLSTSLRMEAVRFGVRVSALCPGPIDTPLLDTRGPSDLPQPWVPDLRRYLGRITGPSYPASKLAEAALRGVEANQPLIIVPGAARAGVWLQRLAPGLLAAWVRRAARAELREKPPSSA